MIERTNPSSTQSIMIKGKCDVCNKKDGHLGHNLQKCKDCGLLVHELCYGQIGTSSKNPNFVCHACKAVGTRIELNVPSMVGGPGKNFGREEMVESTRPTECALCSVDDGIHAMHPLFDTHGKNGRQLVLQATGKKEKRLAWVHTLCAQFICGNPWTAGCVYGLNEDGEFETDKADGDCEVDESSEEKGDDVDEASNDEGNDRIGSLSAFAIAGKDKGSETNWTKCINKQRKELKCSICGREDKYQSLRIPVQCAFGDSHEFIKFQTRHPHDMTPCNVGMHVGCARWKAEHQRIHGKLPQSCYYYSGQQPGEGDIDISSEQVLNCFCIWHSRMIAMNKPKDIIMSKSILGGETTRASEYLGKRPGRKMRSNTPPTRRQPPKLCTKQLPQLSTIPRKVMKPFGRRDPDVSIPDVKDQKFSFRGKSSRALTKTGIKSTALQDNLSVDQIFETNSKTLGMRYSDVLIPKAKDQKLAARDDIVFTNKKTATLQNHSRTENSDPTIFENENDSRKCYETKQHTYPVISENKHNASAIIGPEDYPRQHKRRHSELLNKGTRINVCGLPWKTSKNDVKNFFVRFGEVVNVEFPYGYGCLCGDEAIIDFNSSEASVAAVQEGGNFQGHQLDITIIEKNIILLVRNLGSWSTEKQVRSFFERWGQVIDCDLPKRNGRFGGFAYVTMPPKEGKVALTEAHGAEFDGNNLRMTEA